MINIEKYLSSLKNQLLHSDNWHPALLTPEWVKGVHREPGVYALKEKSKIIYVGETGNLRKRMRDLMDSRHHCVRRTMGEKLFVQIKGYAQATTKKKFPPHIETLLNSHITKNLKIAYLAVSLGRKELEELIVDEIGHDVRLNKRARRKK